MMASLHNIVGSMRAIRRMCAFVIVLLWYLTGLLLRILLFGASETRGFRIRKHFTRVAMRIFGVQLTVRGNVPRLPALYVSNHRSLLDPIIQLHFIDAYVVAKSEISGYPLIGKGARETGVVFVLRESKESRAATRAAIRALLEIKKSVLIYPEGTTSNVPTTQLFKIGAFEIAAEINATVIPVAIHYGNPAHQWQDGSMLNFFMHKFASKRIAVALSFGEPMQENDATLLMRRSREWIGEEISALKAATFVKGTISKEG